MKAIFKSCVLMALVLLAINMFAQDMITKKDGTDIQAIITEVATNEVKYKKFDNQNGPTFTLFKSDILMIKYQNGTKDIFNETLGNQSKGDMCIKGQFDAARNYNGDNSGKGWVCATAIVTSPLFALIPAVLCSSIQPSDKNLKYPNSELMKDTDYNRCYLQKAHETKRKKIWRNFGIGSGVWLAIILIANGN